MTLFLLQKGAKDFHFILGGLFVASMENAATIRKISSNNVDTLKTNMSLFTADDYDILFHRSLFYKA